MLINQRTESLGLVCTFDQKRDFILLPPVFVFPQISSFSYNIMCTLQ
jgi:hypothetical protein